MPELAQATPRVKKNIFLIRLLLAIVLISWAVVYVQANPEHHNGVILFIAALAATFLPFLFWDEEVFDKVRFQYIVFSMDFLFLLGGLYLFDHFETNLLIIIFLTFFISALSQSVGRSILVAAAVISLYVYLIYFKSDVFNYLDPVLLLSCALPLVVAIHSSYLAYRTIQDEAQFSELSKTAALLSVKVKEGDQAALDYAASLRNILDSLPFGALAVSTEGNILFANVKAGQYLETNHRTLTNLSLYMKDSPMKEIGERMGKALKERRELKKEQVCTRWKNSDKFFQLDSSTGSSPTGKVWGTLFTIQETGRSHETPASRHEPAKADETV